MIFYINKDGSLYSLGIVSSKMALPWENTGLLDAIKVGSKNEGSHDQIKL